MTNTMIQRTIILLLLFAAALFTVPALGALFGGNWPVFVLCAACVLVCVASAVVYAVLVVASTTDGDRL